MGLKNMQNRQVVIDAIIYIGSFLLFWEWLRPLEKITDTENILIFVLYTGFCFFLSYMQLQWYISTPLKLLGLLFILDGIFFYDPFLSSEWREQFFADISFNVGAIMNQQWWEMTPIFRSLLFLILLWLMSYLLSYWFVVAKRVMFFVLITFIYLTVIDTFTVYDGKYAIIRTFLISMIVVGLANFQRILIKEKIFRIPREKYLAWIAPLVAVILFSSIVGYAAPKFNPQWPDPVPFLKSAAESVTGSGSNGSGVKKVGYGENDEKLGGSFVQDDTVVFHASSKFSQYWKIETKDVYTGKGWVRSDEEEEFIESFNGSIEMRNFSHLVETDPHEGQIDFNPDEQLPKLAYPYGTNFIDLPNDALYLTYREQSNEIFARNQDRGETPLSSYGFEFDQPTFSLKALREVEEVDPDWIQERYTQLPDNLPDRIEDLALEITADKDNRYDKVKAIEDYFDRGFRYQTTDVAVPGSNEDYVDQFLFDTKVGYCDNFSTSMVVMLRTLDIPARWVKGFAPGESVETLDDGMRIYEVTNSNAHSWVEVYFPQIGWVPFEPTIGFFNPVDFTSGLDLQELLNNAQEEPDVPVDTEPEKPEVEKEDVAKSDDSSFSISTKQLVIFGSVMLILIVLLYFTRFKWLAWYKLKKYKNKQDVDTYIKEYKFLLSLLASKGYKLRNDQTLREFAIEVDRKLETVEMRRLTSQYERIIYRNELDSAQWNKLYEHWKSIVNRIITNM